MKIAFVYDAVYPWIKGGAEKRIYEIGKRLADKGHEVHWYGIGWWFEGNNSRTIDYNGIILHGVCEPMQLYVDGRRSIKEAIYFAYKLFPKLIKEKFDVIDCQEFPYFPCFTAKVHSLFRRTPLVITWHEIWGDYWYEYLGRKGVFGKIIEKLITKLAQMNIVGPKYNMEKLISMGVSKDRITAHLIGGICFEDIQKIPPKDENIDVIFVGRLIRAKGVDMLLRAIACLRENHWEGSVAIVGDGPERKNLESLSKELGIQDIVKFFGRIESDEEVISLMKSAKVFVYPTAPEGGWAINIIEANACGLPAISVQAGNLGTNEAVIHGYNGLLIPEQSAKLLGEKIKLILEDESLRKTLSKNAIKFAKQQDWDVITKELLKVYHIVAANSYL